MSLAEIREIREYVEDCAERLGCPNCAHLLGRLLADEMAQLQPVSTLYQPYLAKTLSTTHSAPEVAETLNLVTHDG